LDAEALTTTLPYVEAKGSHREIGRAVGESLRDGLQRVAEHHQAGLEKSVGLTRALDVSRSLMPFAERNVPDCVEELRGMAEGSGVDFDVLFTMNALQEVRFLLDKQNDDVPSDEECTSLGVGTSVTANGHVLLAHNEDAGTIRNSLPYVVHATPDNAPAFVGFAYSGLLLYQGVNEHGVASTGNALYFNDIRPGTPKLLAYRDVLSARYLEDAILRTHRDDRGNGNNHVVASQEGDIYDIEVSATDYALIPAEDDILVHANHANAEKMKAHQPAEILLNSVMREHRVFELLKQQRGSLTVEGIFDILSDHSNFPKSVCKHADPDINPHVETVASLVIDLTAREIHVRPGHPCEGNTNTFGLNA
jgi:isopenicillin-N N-acyltransferase like protein